MIRVSVFYPYSTEAQFDHRYYAANHMPMVLSKLKPFGCVRWEIDRGQHAG